MLSLIYLKHGVLDLVNRAADSTIKGFLYQFEKTLYEILSSDDNASITIEGIEDIDVLSTYETKLIQCKYHEEQDNYSLSKIYKPVILMLKDWFNKQDHDIEYVLYCFFPNEEHRLDSITFGQIKTILSSTDQKLQSYINEINGFIASSGEGFLHSFCDKFKIQFAESYDSLVEKNKELLTENDFESTCIKEIFYPNAIAEIAKISIQKNIEDRTITKSIFLSKLRTLDKVLLSKYTKYLRSYRQILTTKRKQLKTTLSLNTRKRCFIFEQSTIDNFEHSIISFIKQFLDTFYYKKSKIHMNNICIPIFIVFATQEEYKNIILGLRTKDIDVNTGSCFGVEDWSEQDFYKDAVIDLKNKMMSFRVRFMLIDESNFNSRLASLSRYRIDDIFIINPARDYEIDVPGTDKEVLIVNNMGQLKYLLNMVGDYE